MRWQWGSAFIVSGLLGLSAGCAAVPPCPPPDTVGLSASQSPPTPPEAAVSMHLAAPAGAPAILALERKVKMQEKRIAELSSQLRLLKRIDLEHTKP